MVGWFQRWRGPRARRQTITDSVHWHVVSADLYRVLPALPGLVPAGSILGLGEGVWSRRMRAFLDERAATPEAEVLAEKPWEFEQAGFLSVDRETLRRLSEIAEECAPTEIALHLIGLNGGQTLLEWYDLPGDPIALQASFEEDPVRRFAAAVGGRHELSEPGR